MELITDPSHYTPDELRYELDVRPEGSGDTPGQSVATELRRVRTAFEREARDGVDFMDYGRLDGEAQDEEIAEALQICEQTVEELWTRVRHQYVDADEPVRPEEAVQIASRLIHYKRRLHRIMNHVLSEENQRRKEIALENVQRAKRTLRLIIEVHTLRNMSRPSTADEANVTENSQGTSTGQPEPSPAANVTHNIPASQANGELNAVNANAQSAANAFQPSDNQYYASQRTPPPPHCAPNAEASRRRNEWLREWEETKNRINSVAYDIRMQVGTGWRMEQIRQYRDTLALCEERCRAILVCTTDANTRGEINEAMYSIKLNRLMVDAETQRASAETFGQLPMDALNSTAHGHTARNRPFEPMPTIQLLDGENWTTAGVPQVGQTNRVQFAPEPASLFPHSPRAIQPTRNTLTTQNRDEEHTRYAQSGPPRRQPSAPTSSAMGASQPLVPPFNPARLQRTERMINERYHPATTPQITIL